MYKKIQFCLNSSFWTKTSILSKFNFLNFLEILISVYRPKQKKSEIPTKLFKKLYIILNTFDYFEFFEELAKTIIWVKHLKLSPHFLDNFIA